MLLGEPQAAWRDLQWFWEHQASPGLFTWWEGSGEENTFHRWENVRGWVKPPHVTPHYWTAAEMLLFQLDMLVCLDVSTPEPVLIIGAGVPAQWLERPLRVSGIGTRLGAVAWSWDGKRGSVHVAGFKRPVRLGKAFPASTRVSLN